jgi:hypothetical protein
MSMGVRNAQAARTRERWSFDLRPRSSSGRTPARTARLEAAPVTPSSAALDPLEIPVPRAGERLLGLSAPGQHLVGG